MAVITTTSQITTAGTAAASGNADSSGLDASAAVGLFVGASMTFGAATEGATIEVYADPAGASAAFTIDDKAQPVAVLDVALVASDTVTIGMVVPHQAKYYKVRVANLDSSVSITAINVYAQLKTA